MDIRRKYFTLHCYIARQLNLEPGNAEDFWRLKRNRAPSTLLLGKGGAGEAARYDRLWLELIETSPFTKLDAPFPGALDILRGLRCSATLVLATLRKDPDVVRGQLQRLGLAPLFDEVLVSGDYPSEPQAKSALIQHSKWKDGEPAVVVGDTEEDAAAAEAIHAHFIAADTGLREGSLLREKATALISSLHELPSAVAGILRNDP